MNNEKRFECDVVVMPGAELDTDICCVYDRRQ